MTAFFERIDVINTICDTFYNSINPFNDFTYSVPIENEPITENQLVAQTLLAVCNLFENIHLMIHTLQSEIRYFKAILNSQITDVVINRTLMSVSKNHHGWCGFMECQKFIVTTIYPLEIYRQISLEIENHVDIIRIYCTILTGFLDNVRLLDSIQWNTVNNPDLLNTAEIMRNDCIRIFTQTELHLINQNRVKYNITIMSRIFHRNRVFRRRT